MIFTLPYYSRTANENEQRKGVMRWTQRNPAQIKKLAKRKPYVPKMGHTLCYDDNTEKRGQQHYSYTTITTITWYTLQLHSNLRIP